MLSSFRNEYFSILSNVSLEELRTHCKNNNISTHKVKKDGLIYSCLEAFASRFYTKRQYLETFNQKGSSSWTKKELIDLCNLKKEGIVLSTGLNVQELMNVFYTLLFESISMLNSIGGSMVSHFVYSDWIIPYEKSLFSDCSTIKWYKVVAQHGLPVRESVALDSKSTYQLSVGTIFETNDERLAKLTRREEMNYITPRLRLSDGTGWVSKFNSLTGKLQLEEVDALIAKGVLDVKKNEKKNEETEDLDMKKSTNTPKLKSKSISQTNVVALPVLVEASAVIESKAAIESNALTAIVTEVAIKKKYQIPKKVKVDVWNAYIGQNIPVHKCICCKTVLITNTSFEVGHVIAEANGGTSTIMNLRPICSACNTSMGTRDMREYVLAYGYLL